MSFFQCPTSGLIFASKKEVVQYANESGNSDFEEIDGQSMIIIDSFSKKYFLNITDYTEFLQRRNIPIKNYKICTIVKYVETKEAPISNSNKLTAEELERRIIEHRRTKEIEEKNKQREEEKQRHIQGKLKSQTCQYLDEIREKAHRDQILKEKELAEAQRRQVEEELDRDYFDRFGKARPKHTNIENNNTLKGSKDEIMSICLNPHVNYEGLLLVSKYFKNIVKTNGIDENYLKINMENVHFINKINKNTDILRIFSLVGFDIEGQFLIAKQRPDLFLISEFLKYLDIIQRQRG